MSQIVQSLFFPHQQVHHQDHQQEPGNRHQQQPVYADDQTKRSRYDRAHDGAKAAARGNKGIEPRRLFG